MIRNMREKGMSIRSIVRELNISRNSLRKYLNSEPSGKRERKRGSKLDPYREQIKSLIKGHNLTTVRILEEIRKNGYTGGYTILKEYCRELRKNRKIQAVYRYIFFYIANNKICTA